MRRARLEQWLNDVWYRRPAPPPWLQPLTWLYRGASGLRRALYRTRLLPSRHPGVTVIVVGNLTVGGTGKTPFVIALCRLLREAGRRPGILCRGYGGTACEWPREVSPDSDPGETGDEAVLLARASACPVYAGADRYAAARALLENHAVDVLVCDDGLQHLRLARDIELLMIDPVRGFGNGCCLPSGPLREPLSRLQGVDATVAVGRGHPLARFEAALRVGEARAVADPSRRRPLSAFAGRACHLVTGIAAPERFQAVLEKAGLRPDTRFLPDHHRFREEDIRFEDDLPVLMTEKDAVKCRDFAGNDVWYVPIELEPGAEFGRWLNQTLKRKTRLG